MPSIAQWDVNDDCNLNCKHCRVAEKNLKEPALSLKQGIISTIILLWCNKTKFIWRGTIFAKRYF